MVWILLVLAVLALDQGSKAWVVANLPLHIPRPVIPGILQLTYTHNRGAAFGILQNRQYFFVAASVIVCVLLYYYREELTQGKPLLKLATALVVGGAIGNNLFDRVFRGYVVDFLEVTFVRFPVFNIADSAIVVGVTLFILDLLLSSFGSSPKAG